MARILRLLAQPAIMVRAVAPFRMFLILIQTLPLVLADCPACRVAAQDKWRSPLFPVCGQHLTNLKAKKFFQQAKKQYLPLAIDFEIFAQRIEDCAALVEEIIQDPTRSIFCPDLPNVQPYTETTARFYARSQLDKYTGWLPG